MSDETPLVVDNFVINDNALIQFLRKSYLQSNISDLVSVQPMAQDTISNMGFPTFTMQHIPFVEETEKIERIKRVKIKYLGEI